MGYYSRAKPVLARLARGFTQKGQFFCQRLLINSRKKISACRNWCDNFVSMIVNHLKAPRWGEEEMEMTAFMTEDFLLDTEFARRLYHDYAKDQPIFDYHCHLPPQQIAENYRFKTCMTSG